VDTRICQRHVAGFPAIRAVVEAVYAKMDLLHAFADAAILFTTAKGFRFVALLANNRTARHECLHKNCT
jgi:hypothetical protein